MLEIVTAEALVLQKKPRASVVNRDKGFMR
jgi:hypothetical protein